ncbi:peptide chain release factor N(5)-glutamine methyltransferase [Candidatus Odyssella thessalonicensis]|uniref:peptide chain release factor N(5)-glutamine methyltransferase n=1 Tax=Candidatus Odyssella thessalonicensis TaxID=84647 RepID=UPI000225B717|nr:peptide chain release factor N(5)-glutamine methyltransferase [Candidatus Odyssella thessalonicensis]
MNFHTALKDFLRLIQHSPAENPLRELRLLIGHALGISYEQLLFEPPPALNATQVKEIEQLIQRRCQHEPLAKILGYKEFWGLRFKVTADTLDPRPDSETLIETSLRYIPKTQDSVQILDLGTGSGCLLLSLLTELPKAQGTGVDISSAALAVARMNAAALGMQERCQFVVANWMEGLSQTFDLIIANPPYIDRSEVLSRQTLYDPESALFADEQGLVHYKTILKSAREYLRPGGVIIFEIGYAQAEAVTQIGQDHKFNLVEKIRDFNGLDRCLVFS